MVASWYRAPEITKALNTVEITVTDSWMPDFRGGRRPHQSITVGRGIVCDTTEPVEAVAQNLTSDIERYVSAIAGKVAELSGKAVEAEVVQV